jgi:hypothetical protein
MLRAKYPNLDANNIINRVIKTAIPQSTEPYSPIYGYGLIDPQKALTAQVALVDSNPLGSLAEWVELYRRSAESESIGEVWVPVVPNELDNPDDFDTTQIVPIAVYVFLGVLVVASLIKRLRRRQ